MYKALNKSSNYAVFFDLDGTLLDSEPITEEVVKNWLKRNKYCLTAEIISESLHGITWLSIAKKLQILETDTDPASIAKELERNYFDISNESDPELLPGAHKAFSEAATYGCTGIVTGSSKRFVENFLTRKKLVNECTFYISSENYSASKPHPEPYILAAERSKCEPKNCLVFEDSIAGVKSATDAGMHVVAVAHQDTPQRKITPLGISDYNELPSNFFSRWFGGQLAKDNDLINSCFSEYKNS
ncbi:MAG: HAD family phosphatase [Candidatus Latescibacterota bacterium]|nr:HAD family phosphatase [Candidatus Latescibacterota bacterium]